MARYKGSAVPGLWARETAAMMPWAIVMSHTYMHVNILYVSGIKHSFYDSWPMGDKARPTGLRVVKTNWTTGSHDQLAYG